MSILTRSAVVDAPVETVFEYALDPRKLWSVPDIALAEVEVKPEGAGTTARIWYHFLGFHLEGGLEYKEVTRPERIVIEVNFFMEHPTWTFTFEPLDGGTGLTMRAAWHVKAPAVGSIMDAIKAREHESMAEQWLNAVKNRMTRGCPVM